MSYEVPWGDEVGEGWRLHVLNCHRQLKHLDPGYRIGQIKEKFGGLRYYFDPSVAFNDLTHDIMESVVKAAEYNCSITCEVCGSYGSLRTNSGWYKTLCDEHAKEHRAAPVNPYGVCAHTKSVGSVHCVHDAWQAGYKTWVEEMTTHLPECFETWQIPRKCNICDALRACEQRVSGELLIANTPPVTDQQWIDDARRGGYEDALDDAIAFEDVIKTIDISKLNQHQFVAVVHEIFQMFRERTSDGEN